jgi:hypothetical protein
MSKVGPPRIVGYAFHRDGDALASSIDSFHFLRNQLPTAAAVQILYAHFKPFSSLSGRPFEGIFAHKYFK